ncbi:MAG TPA: MlaD family protein [Bacteroidia bacterium]|nr:MlaD family protein [Bacteroidia bacterium]HMU20004.1 MlaD family protein [Bacteroidia bacterium]
MKISNEVKVGIAFTLTIAGFFWGMNFLKGTDLFSTSNKYYVVYDDVNGIVKSNPVIMNGFKIGQVDKIVYAEDKSGRLIVTLRVDDNVFIPKSSNAVIVSSDLLGSKAIELEMSEDKTPAKNGDTLVGNVQSGLTDQIKPLKSKAEGLVTSLDSLSFALTQLINERSRSSLNNIFANLEHTTEGLDKMVNNSNSKLNSMLANIDGVAGNLNNKQSDINGILKNVNSLSDSLSRLQLNLTIEKLNKTIAELNSVLGKIDNSQGSLGKLVNDDSLYNNLNSASANLDKLLIDLKANPGRYVNISVFGKKNK